MTVRTLPREEWHRLDAETRAFVETLDPEDVALVVVERDGAIVARLAVLRIPQWESFWIAPEAKGNAGITRALLRHATEKAREWAPHWIIAQADCDDTRLTLQRLGGHLLPVDTFMLPLQRVEMEETCPQP